MLTGKLAFISGAGSGIGRAACVTLAKQGARIIAADINLANAKKTIENLDSGEKEHLALAVDVANVNNVNEALSQILSKYKVSPNVVVNSAGITRDNFLLKLSQEDFEEVININLKGTFNVMQTFGNSIVKSNYTKGASFINIASIAGKIANIGQCNYNASKVGVEAITKTAAKELGKFNIRCNVLLPGFINTPMTKTVPEKVLNKITGLIPLQRMGEADEIAEVIAFLASDKSSYVNGASIEVTGGFF